MNSEQIAEYVTKLEKLGWHIEYAPKPIPMRDCDYDFWHDEYDYADDTGSIWLAGTAESFEDAINQIIEIDDSIASVLGVNQ